MSFKSELFVEKGTGKTYSEISIAYQRIPIRFSYWEFFMTYIEFGMIAFENTEVLACFFTGRFGLQELA